MADRQIRRRDLAEADLAAMGRFLGRLHRVLQTHSADDLRSRRVNLDRMKSLAEVDRLVAKISARPPGEASDEWAVARLRSRRQWLAARPDGESLDELDGLPWQPLHGDYQETNLFFRDGEVSAIVDWDNAGILPRAWEVARVLDFVCSFETERSLPLLDAYRAELPLDLGELDIGVRGYGLMRAYDLWMFTAIFDEGMDRLRRFLNGKPFVPFVDRWQPLLEKLARGQK